MDWCDLVIPLHSEPSTQPAGGHLRQERLSAFHARITGVSEEPDPRIVRGEETHHCRLLISSAAAHKGDNVFDATLEKAPDAVALPDDNQVLYGSPNPESVVEKLSGFEHVNSISALSLLRVEVP